MGRVTSALLEHVADVIVSLQQTCFVATLSSFQIDVSNTQTVDINNITVNSNNQAGVQTCTSTSTIARGPLATALQKKLMDSLVQNTAAHLQGDVTRLVATIVQSITVEVATSCYALAINSILIRVGNVKNKAVFDNLNVTQIARASIVTCIQNAQVTVGNATQPLGDYLNDYLNTEVSGLSVVPAPNSVISPSGALVTPAATSCGFPFPIIITVVIFCVVSAACAFLLYKQKHHAQKKIRHYRQ